MKLLSVPAQPLRSFSVYTQQRLPGVHMPCQQLPLCLQLPFAFCLLCGACYFSTRTTPGIHLLQSGTSGCAVQVLEGLGLTQDQFIDLCILCGCDYCGTIKGAGDSVLQRPGMILACYSGEACTSRASAAGKSRQLSDAQLHLAEQCPALQPGLSSTVCLRLDCPTRSPLCTHTSWLPAGIGGKRAISLLKQHNNLEGVLESLDPSKYDIPNPYPYQEARRLFKGQQGGPGLHTHPQRHTFCTPSLHLICFFG